MRCGPSPGAVRGIRSLRSANSPLPENRFNGTNYGRHRSEEFDGLIDKLFVTARISEAGIVKATGTVSTRGAAKVYRFKSVKRSIAANVKTKMRLKLRKKQLRAVKRAIKRRKSLKAKITVSATDKSGNTRSHKLTIRLVN